MSDVSKRLGVINKGWRLLGRDERAGAIVMLGLMLVGMMFEMLGVGLVVPVIGLLSTEDYLTRFPALQPILDAMGNPDRMSLVIISMISLVLIYLVKALYLSFYRWRQMRFSFGIQARLSKSLFDQYLAQPYVFHLQNNSAQLIRNTTLEVGMFINNGVNPVMVIILESFVVIGLCLLLLSIETKGTLLTICVAGIAGATFHHLTKGYMAKWGAQRQYHEGLRIQHLQQGLGGAKEVKLMGKETFFSDRYNIHNSMYAKVEEFRHTLLSLPTLWFEVLAVLGLATLVVTMSLLGYKIGEILPVLGLFAAAAFRLIPSVTRIIRAGSSLRFGIPVIDLLHDEFKTGLQETVKQTDQDLSFNDILEVADVSYTYPGNKSPSLKNITVRIRRGESVGFIGRTGSGKSTLVDVLLGLLSPEKGSVTIDGNSISDNVRYWMRQIGYVPQTIYLIDDTLRRNIAFGLPDEQVSDEDVWEALKLAQLDEFVKSLPEGLDTKAGERGMSLSGGQRQRIGIARALYHKPIVLVMDEATSSLDINTEEGVMEAVSKLGGEKTIIIIAHRMSTVTNCDRLYKLQDGEILDEGTPAELQVDKA